MSSPRRQLNQEVEVEDTLTAADRARIMLNTPDLANRFAEFGEATIPIIHLGIAQFERFRAACTPIEEFYKTFCESELPIVDFLRIYSDEAKQIFNVDVPKAASIATRTLVEYIYATCKPLQALAIVLAQWMHNLEIVRLQNIFPHPDPDSTEFSDPNVGNPMTILERMAASYPWSKTELLEVTGPQVYLMGVSSAWSYERAKSDSDHKPTPKSKVKSNNKPDKKFKAMKLNEYKNYLASVGLMQSEDGSISQPILGGV